MTPSETIVSGLERAILLLSRDGAWADRGKTWTDDDALAIVRAYRAASGRDRFHACGIPRVFTHIPCVVAEDWLFSLSYAEAEERYRDGRISEDDWETYCAAWRNSAPRSSSLAESYSQAIQEREGGAP